MLKEEFKTMLGDRNISSRYIVRKYLIYGEPYFFRHELDNYMSIKEQVANKFGIHPHNVLLVGSAKLGFSIAPNKKWKDFDSESDIDIVIVSESTFQNLWQELFLFNSNISRSQDEDQRFNKFKDYFFRGWIRPDYFSFNYKGKKEWFEFFMELTKQYGQGHKITGALYYNFDFFEKYHINNIDNLRKVEDQNG